jgi:lipopolysaccharide transport system ATP-binding protein
LTEPPISVRKLSKAYNLYDKPRDLVIETLIGGKRHDVFWALRDLSFDINEGDRVGFVGPNGAGKSTLLKIISGNLRQTTGAVKVNGKVSAMLSLTSFLNVEETGIQNVRFNLVMAGIPKKEIPSLTEEIVDFTELGAFIHAPVRTYSSGMSARLSFGISTAITPDILIVDEILGAGDAYFAAKATMRMIELCKEGRALLFVSHSPAAVQLLCNRAIWIDNGSVRADGDVHEVISQYEADFRRQEDESMRSGNAALSAQRVNSVLPEELERPDIARIRLTGPNGRVTDTHYIRSISVETAQVSRDISLGLEHIDEPGVSGALDLTRSEWGRPHERKGFESRVLAPSSRPLRGGHILIRRPTLENGPQPITISFEATSISRMEPLKAQLADSSAARWTDLALVVHEPESREWERIVYRGVLEPPDATAHRALLEQIVDESKPDVETLAAFLIVNGQRASRVRERQPFVIQVHVRAHRRVPIFDVSLKLMRTDGYYVFWQSSGQVGHNIEDFTGDKLVSFVFDPNLIGAGDYELTVEIQNGFDVENNFPYSRVYDRKVAILRFTVDREWGLLMLGPLNHRFRVVVEDGKVDSGEDINPSGLADVDASPPGVE